MNLRCFSTNVANRLTNVRSAQRIVETNLHFLSTFKTSTQKVLKAQLQVAFKRGKARVLSDKLNGKQGKTSVLSDKLNGKQGKTSVLLDKLNGKQGKTRAKPGRDGKIFAKTG